MPTIHVTMPIEGLGCWGSGALIVERAMATAPGVVQVYVNPVTEMAYIEYDVTATDPRHLAAVIEHAGFHAGPVRVH